MLSCFTEPLETVAAQLVILQQSRPVLLKDPVGYKEHMHQEYLLYEELLLRTDADRTIELIAQANKTMELLSPPPKKSTIQGRKATLITVDELPLFT